jgi:protocatechuate 3,4-dioxygenase beta subunit
MGAKKSGHKLGRRDLLATLGAGAAGALAACASNPTSPSTTGGVSTGGGSGTCVVSPSETEGPYVDRIGMVSNQAFYRRDVTEGRPGIPLTLVLTVVNTNANCAPVSGANVEIWQCDASGNYSEYAQPGYNGTGQTFLRGLQTSDSNGQVTFNTIYPGWYMGRATHIHVQVFRGTTVVKTTQIALPESVSQTVYRTGVYAAKGLNPTTNTGDMVFADSLQNELATLTGDATAGFRATLTIGVAT